MNTEFISTATNLANEKMEQIFADKRSKGYSFIAPNNYPSETNPNGYNGYIRSVAISTNSTNKMVVVTVTHNSIEPCVLTAWLTNY
jgi:hypothetical protein